MSIAFLPFLCETLLLVSFCAGGEPAHDTKSALDVKIHAVLPNSTAQHRHSVVIGSNESISSTGDQVLFLG